MYNLKYMYVIGFITCKLSYAESKVVIMVCPKQQAVLWKLPLKRVGKLVKCKDIGLLKLVFIVKRKVSRNTVNKLLRQNFHCVNNGFVNVFQLLAKHIVYGLQNHFFLINNKNLKALFVGGDICHTITESVS